MIDWDTNFTAKKLTVREIDYGHTMWPNTGGRGQRINRDGNKFEMEVTLPPVRSHEDGERLAVLLMKAKREGLRMRVPTFGFDSTVNGVPPGAPTITLQVNPPTSIFRIQNFTNQYVPQPGQYFSVTSNGSSYLHKVFRRLGGNVDAGEVNLEAYPVPRALYQVADAVEFEHPVIEGMLVGDSVEWDVRIANLMDIVFTIREY